MGVGSVEIRAAASSGGPVITGYAAVFDSPSSDMGFVEVIDPAAFNRTLNVADVRALVNHDPNQLLGRSKSGTLRLSTDATGLRYEIDVNQADQSALDAVAKVRRGDMDGASFSFQTIRDEWNFNVEPPQRRLLEVALVDVGPVSFPAYQAATAQSRSMQAQSMKDRAWELHARSVTRLTGRLDALRLAVPEAFQDAL
jgi:hypothetical protein